MKKNKDDRYQQKLSHKEQYGGGYEREFLRNPESGPLTTDVMFGEIDSLEFFVPSRLRYYRDRLKKKMAAYPDDLVKIDAGLASYVNSAVEPTRELALLIQSVQGAFPNCLRDNYEHNPAEIQQAISATYFESYDWVDPFEIAATDLIKPESLQHYQKHADKITMAAIKAWWRYLVRKDADHAPEFEKVPIYQGINHGEYYKKTQNRPDKLSAYTDLDHFPFFQSELLSSYTLSFDVASKFVSGTLYSKGQRRLMISGHPDMVGGRIFSSWFVSEAFLNGQFELLCLPNPYPLFTNWQYHNEIAAGFALERGEDV
ncbi:hypothetical protein [Mucilaginibacter agri]|uniref:Uncharacterized protein n=1 Tax=Mucilaginibacter agri TaxID=2695265 RepID=A0A965ZD91_9SPHI|nr:hypothetical protein [Mucilaginibacter agri]NCD67904.1 hypothetical protein [Mucilaginibacter agri]